MSRALGLSLLLLAFKPGGLDALQLRIWFLDVGQGDAAVITTPEGHNVLIDAGRNDRDVASVLRNEGIDTLILVIASHAHADHIGGMVGVFGSAVVRNYMDNAVPYPTTATYRRTMQTVTKSGARYLEPTARTITVGSVRFRVLPPPHVDNEQNNNSVGVLVQYGAFRALLTGDSELRELRHWLDRDTIPRVQLVKVAHHGSHNGTSSEWVAATQPDVAIVSVSARNGYGHPAPQALSQWSRGGATVFSTARHGTIAVLADSSGSFTVSTSLGSWAWEPTTSERP